MGCTSSKEAGSGVAPQQGAGATATAAPVKVSEAHTHTHTDGKTGGALGGVGGGIPAVPASTTAVTEKKDVQPAVVASQPPATPAGAAEDPSHQAHATGSGSVGHAATAVSEPQLHAPTPAGSAAAPLLGSPVGEVAGAAASPAAHSGGAGEPTGVTSPISPTPVVDMENIQEVVAAAARSGVPAVLALMKEHAENAEFQWWCLDALTGLTAGNADARAQIYVQNGLSMALAAMGAFKYEENVQTKGNWLLAGMAADYAEYMSKQGAVEAIVSGMQACQDSYQVQTSGTRALQILVDKHEPNRVRAKTAGAVPLLKETLERNPEDGQLKYRGDQLLQRLESLTESDMKAAAAAVVPSRNQPWNRLRDRLLADPKAAREVARRLAAGNVPGLHGVSAQVGAKAREGIVHVVKFMRDRPHSSEVAMWCCDALFTMINGNSEIRRQAHDAGAIELVISRMNADLWNEELVLKGCWALLQFAPEYPVQIGEKGGIDTVVLAMYRNKTNHDVQVAAIKLLSLLTREPTGANVKRAQHANAVRIVKNVIQAHTDDGQLQYRGINLLERLEPGCTASMPKVNMIRSASMQAEEMVFNIRSVARLHSTRTAPNTGRDAAEVAAANAAAIQEVDEMAEQVDEDEEEDDKQRKASVHAADTGVASASQSAANTTGVAAADVTSNAEAHSETAVKAMSGVPTPASKRSLTSNEAADAMAEAHPSLPGSVETPLRSDGSVSRLHHLSDAKLADADDHADSAAALAAPVDVQQVQVADA